MKYYCNMQNKKCRDVFTILDEFDLKDCIHPSLFPLYDGNEVPYYVGSNWTIGQDGVWVDPLGVSWPDGVPSGPTLFDPNYTGGWPPQQEPKTPEEPSE